MTKGTILIIILLVLILIAIIYLILNLNPEPDEDYHQSLKKILSTFEEILVRIDKIPNLKNRTFVKIDKMDALVDIQQEIRKPIYYIENINCTDFMIISKEEVCTYSLKVNEAIVSPLEAYIEEVENNRESNKEEKILEDIEKTTIIKTVDGSVFKVSPLRVDKNSKKHESETPKYETIILEDNDEIEDDEEKAKTVKKEDRAKKYKEKKKKEQRKAKKD